MGMQGLRSHSQHWKIGHYLGKNFSKFGQIMQLHSYSSEGVSILPSTAKPLLKPFCLSLPLITKRLLPLSELESFGNSNSLHQIWVK